MHTIVLIFHVLACLALILIVLLQTGRGAEMGAAFGGSSQTLFGSSGGTTFLGKLTTVAAIVFMITCLGLTYFSGRPDTKSVMEKVQVEEKQGPARCCPKRNRFRRCRRRLRRLWPRPRLPTRPRRNQRGCRQGPGPSAATGSSTGQGQGGPALHRHQPNRQHPPGSRSDLRTSHAKEQGANQRNILLALIPSVPKWWNMVDTPS